ncbi:MAG: PTS sugar transporter subunit IIA [Eubacterium sp.]|nr:PTS sugar transporter subunit IIA [Eubacterium sp.]
MFNGDIIFESSLAESREEAIETLCSRLYEQGRLNDLNAFKKAVFERESEMSTELAPNVFVPHAKSKEVVKPSVAHMKTKDGQSVYLIASNTNDGHIKALAGLARALNDNSINI